MWPILADGWRDRLPTLCALAIVSMLITWTLDAVFTRYLRLPGLLTRILVLVVIALTLTGIVNIAHHDPNGALMSVLGIGLITGVWIWGANPPDATPVAGSEDCLNPQPGPLRFIHFTVLGRQHSFMLDTGSTVELIRESTAKQLGLPIYRDDSVLPGRAIGNRMDLQRFVKVDIQECGHTYRLKMYVVPDLFVPFLLGITAIHRLSLWHHLTAKAHSEHYQSDLEHTAACVN